MLLVISNISKRYGEKDVLTNFSFSLEQGHRVALVGQNGVGKSTLLKILAGLETADTGEIVLAKDRTLGYLPQETPDENQPLLEYIQASPKAPFPKHIMYTIFDGLNVPSEIHHKTFGQISGGQKTKVLLTRFLLEKPDIALFDEPTNNLDIPSLVWLEEYIKQSNQAMIVVSHDPYFLKSVTDRLVEIDALTKKITTSRGSYIDYLEKKGKDLKTAQKRHKEALRERERLMKTYSDSTRTKALIDRDEQPEKNEEKMGADARKQRGGEKTQKAMKQLKQRAFTIDIPNKPLETENFTIRIKARPAKENGEIKFGDMVCGYPKGLILDAFSIVIPFGTRICMLGENGSGKSTFLRTLTSQQQPLSGTINIGTDLVCGDLMQHHEQMDAKDTAKLFFETHTRLHGEQVYNKLKQYGIEAQYADKPIEVLSPGARARVLFAIFEQRGVNTLVLDEPTNHLDIDATNALIEMLKTYEGTVILTTHNRWFLEQVTIDMFYCIQQKRIIKIDDFALFVEQAKKASSRITQRLRQHIL